LRSPFLSQSLTLFCEIGSFSNGLTALVIASDPWPPAKHGLQADVSLPETDGR
jgi:hypothetical protein